MLAVTSCKRLSIAPGSFTLESGTSIVIVIVPLGPVVDRQFAAGSCVVPGYVRVPPADYLLGIFASKAL